MLKEPKDFQKATAERILNLFQQGQRRVLLADEVGLGKTVVASNVIKLVGEWHKTDPAILDDHFKVVYVCSNVNIANQNAYTLGVKDTLDVSESRLSMQHLPIYQKAGKNHDYEQLIPLTPSTSFSMTLGCGNQRERALLFTHLRRMDVFKSRDKELNRFMQMSAGKDWKYYVDDYEKCVLECDKNGSNYIAKMQLALKKFFSRKDYLDIIPLIIDFLDTRDNYLCKEGKLLVNRLRKVFAEISLDMMDPDLVIMDEFQRFRNLIDESDADSETNMLIKKFFSNPNTKILLLSATPYKPFSTLEELNENNVDEQYKDFFSLMSFLHTDGEDKSKYEGFQKVWGRYSKCLSQLDSKNFSVLRAAKEDAENALYNVMCRTERINLGIIDDLQAKEIPISVGDILSYNQMQRILELSFERDSKKKNGNMAHTYKVPVEYVKSAPFILSFAEKYDIKKHLFERSFKDDEFPLLDFVKKHRKYMLNRSNIYDYRELESNNARLEYLKKKLFAENHTECLLWVPASHPYYKNVGGVFDANKDFSKILVFSSWEMVPRMLATLLSYEAERLTVGKRHELTYEAIRGVKYGFQGEDGKYIVRFISSVLASFYNPEDYYGFDLKDVIANVRRKVNELLDDVAKKFELERHGRNTASAIRKLLGLIEGIDTSKNSEDSLPLSAIPEYASEVLTNMAIASPAICLYRLFKSKVPKEDAYRMATECADEFVTLFNHRESAAAIYQVYNRRDDSYYEYVLDYCVKGNLQAVLDEYAFMIDKNDEELKSEMIAGFIGGDSSLSVDAYTPEGRKAIRMRTHYALSYANTKLDDKSINRNINIQKVFNSPFRPFVLASTSIGQEGLDFHKYARKIMHWNLPANPVELEQREGRINRFMNLAVRRNIAHKYGYLFGWNDMFEKAKKDYKGNDCDMVPYWYIPLEMIDDMETEKIPIEKIERIVAMYPMSRDRYRYDRLIKILSLYRLTMGQPRQEELLEMLSGRLTEEQIDELLIKLSPIRKMKLAM